MANKSDHLLVYVRTERETSRDSPDDLLYLSGTIDVLAEDTLVVLGPFEGALLLLPTIDVLANGIRDVRAGHRTIEIVLVGDANSLWLVEKRGQHEHMTIIHCDIRTAHVSRDEIDQAFGQAIAEFLETLTASRPVHSWHHEALRILDNVIFTWPSISRLIRRW